MPVFIASIVAILLCARSAAVVSNRDWPIMEMLWDCDWKTATSAIARIAMAIMTSRRVNPGVAVICIVCFFKTDRKCFLRLQIFFNVEYR